MAFPSDSSWGSPHKSAAKWMACQFVGKTNAAGAAFLPAGFGVEKTIPPSERAGWEGGQSSSPTEKRGKSELWVYRTSLFWRDVFVPPLPPQLTPFAANSGPGVSRTRTDSEHINILDAGPGIR